MKKSLWFLLAVCLVAGMLCGAPAFGERSVVINAQTFPDEAFRAFVSSKLDRDKDGVLDEKELAVRDIDCSDKRIESLKGIQYFTALEELNADENEMEALDLSSNPKLRVLSCEGNYLKALDVSKNTRLKELICSANELKALKLGTNSVLVKIDCEDNQLTKLNVQHLPALKTLNCGSNQLTALNTSQNKRLETLTCSNNKLLPRLNLSNNGKLKYLNCINTGLKTLDVTSCPTLADLIQKNPPNASVNYYRWTEGSATLIVNKKVTLKPKANIGVPLKKIRLDKQSATLIRTRNECHPTLKLKVSFIPADATTREVKWTSSNDKVATVDKNGEVTARKAGKTVITCRAKDGGLTAECRITVKDRKITKITLNKTKAEMKIGKTLQLKATVTPADALIRSLKWVSSDPTVAQVDNRGKVTAVGRGKCAIMCKARDGSGTSAVCRIQVK